MEQSVDERKLEDLQDFLDSNIGVIVEIQEGAFSDFFKNFHQDENKDGNGYKVQFDNIPADIAADFCTEEEENIILFNSDEILYHNINKEDCELYFAAKKYNI